MKLLRLLFVLPLLAAGFAPALLACGGWDEEEPATLDQLLPILPAKSLGQIFVETTPPGPKTPAPDYAAEIDKITARIGKDATADLLRAVDNLLAKARSYYADDSWCNALEDIRDVISDSSQKPSAAQGYIRWRVQHLDWFQPPRQEEDVYPPKKPEVTPEKNAELELLTKTASGALKAHWLFLRGALLFKSGDRQKCRDWFQEVVKEFPDHPRAEVARFLLARCDLCDSRSIDYSVPPEQLKAPRAKAIESFKAFRDKYPGGRLDADALGWLGALYYDDGNSLEALRCYIAQAEDAQHPEVRNSAVIMCEMTLNELDAGADNSAVYALLARHPQVAMAYIYQVLDGGGASITTVDNESGNNTGDTAAVKKWRRTVLPLLAAELAKQHDLYKSDDWQPRYLAMLALAASDSGDQAQALQITGVAAEQINRSDDLLFARGLALQRAKRPREAIEVYRTLQKLFPNGPLTTGARLRLALALEDDHQAGAAIVELRPLRSMETGQVDQSIDAILNFAPLPELEKMLAAPELDDAAKSELRAIMAERCLAAEDFAGAKKYMTDAQYGLVAANLEKLTQQAAAAPAGKQRAEKYAMLGDAWAQVRGKLLRQPLANDRCMTAIIGDDAPFVEMPDFISRCANGRALGFAGVEESLDNRDELRHASRWWMRAAREDPGTALAAGVRWKALQAIPVIASQSLYTEQRAREIGILQVSKEIHDKLLAECPDSIEAKRYAAYWSIPDVEKDAQDMAAQWEAARYHIWTDYQDINERGYAYFDYGAFTPDESQDQGDDYAGPEASLDENFWEGMAKRIGNLLPLAAGDNMAPIVKELDDLADKARKNDTPDEAAVLNFLDDMDLFVHEKGITPKMLVTYLGIRVDILCLAKSDASEFWKDIPAQRDPDAIGGLIDEASKDPGMKPVQDYLDCARIALQGAQGGGGLPHDYPKMEKMCRDFLEKYPHSQKREAVTFVLARSVDALTNGTVKNEAPERIPDNDKDMGDVPATDTATPDDQNNSNNQDNQGDQDNQPRPKRLQYPPQRLLEVLNAYDREFPKGRYAAEIRDYRANIAWRMCDWGNALDLTMAELDDGSKPFLRNEAALRLANIFSGLASKDYRADLLDAIRKRPEAKGWLEMYLAKVPAHSDHPLRYLQAYLTDQLTLAKK